MMTETSEKCTAYYMRMIKSGKVNIKENFKNSGRKKEIINISFKLLLYIQIIS